MIRMLHISREGIIKESQSLDHIHAYRKDPNTILWLDIYNEPVDQCEKILTDHFHFHPLAIEDALVQVHVPKIDDWSEYVYIVLHALRFDDSEDDLLDKQELDIFLGDNYLVTYRTESCSSLDNVWANTRRDERTHMRGVGSLLYHLMEEIAAETMQIIDRLDDRVEEIHQQIFKDPNNALLGKLFTTRRSLLTLRRILTPQREVVNKLARGDFNAVKQQDRNYYRDVYDHYVRVHDISESLRDLVGSALETYLSVVNNRMNDIMKTLTIVTTFFMPISFIAAFFGMNFFPTSAGFAGFTKPLGFAFAILLLVFVPSLMFLWLQKRKWL